MESTTNRNAPRPQIDHLEQMVPYLFAIGCMRAWTTLLFVAPASIAGPVILPFDPHAVFDILYAATGIALAVAAPRFAPLQETRLAKPITLAAIILATASMLAASAFPEAAVPLSIAGAILGGAGFCSFLLLHAEAMVPLSLIRIALYTAASRLVAVPIVYFCQGLDATRMALAAILLPIIAMGCVSFAYKSIPADERQRPVKAAFKLPWKLMALLCIYSFVYGMSENQIPSSAGRHSSLSTALVMAALFLLIYFFANRFSISSLYRSPVVMLVCGVLLIPAQGLMGDVVAGYLISMGYTLVTLLISLLFYDLAKRTGMSIVILSGISKAAMLFTIGGRYLTELIERTMASDELGAQLIIMVLIVLSVAATVIILLSEKDLATTWGIHVKTTGGLSEKASRDERVSQRCSIVSRTFHLSPREDEILRLIAQGMSNTAIERELFIANGTLKAHIQHIYVKTGVHSRKELSSLLDICDQDDRDTL